MPNVRRPIIGLPPVNWAHMTQTGVIPEGYELFQDSRPLTIVDKKTLSEDAHGNNVKVMRLTGVFQRADEKNENGRVYPYDVLKDAVASLQPAIKERRVMGEFDHPPDAKIHLDRVSHLITKVWMEGDGVVYGELEVINDDRCPCGSMLACLIERNVQVGISSRGVGDMEITRLNEEEAYAVQPGYSFVTFDSVAEPSVKGTQLMVMESRNRKLQQVAMEAQAQKERELIREIHNFLGEGRKLRP